MHHTHPPTVQMRCVEPSVPEVSREPTVPGETWIYTYFSVRVLPGAPWTVPLTPSQLH